MKYELVWFPDGEVIELFDSEEQAWTYAKNFIELHINEEFTLQEFDVNYVED